MIFTFRTPPTHQRMGRRRGIEVSNIFDPMLRLWEIVPVSREGLGIVVHRQLDDRSSRFCAATGATAASKPIGDAGQTRCPQVWDTSHHSYPSSSSLSSSWSAPMIAR